MNSGYASLLFLIFFFNDLGSVWLLQLDKAYPRDFMQRGRVRVLLKKEDGTLCNPAITSSKGQLPFLFEMEICNYFLGYPTLENHYMSE